MAQYADYKATPNVWTDLYAALTIASGTKTYMQNVGSVPFRVVTSATIPTETDIGLLVKANHADETFTQVAQISPAAGEVAWVKSAGNVTEAIISVQD